MSTVKQGQGFFNLEDDYHQSNANVGFSVGCISGGHGGFPMTGFGGVHSTRWGKRLRDFSVFLAMWGDEEGVEAKGP